MGEYLDRLIDSLERDAEQGRADLHRRQLATNKANRHLAGHVNRITQRLETLKRLQIMEIRDQSRGRGARQAQLPQE
jgi:hypothetical protein